MTVTTYQGDCLELMGNIPDHSVDMVLCDLPYGTTRNQWDSVINLDAMWTQYHRVVTPNGVIALTSQGVFTARLMLSNESMFRYKLVWIKSKATNFLNSKKQPLRKHEDVCIFYADQPIYNPIMSPGTPYDKGTRKDQDTGSYNKLTPVQIKSDGDRCPTDIIYFKTAESEGEVFHPTQKPVALCEYLIRTYTDEGMTVLDNCMGSGTTGVAAVQTGRNFIGIEKDEEYYAKAVERISKAEYKVRNRTTLDSFIGGTS